MRQRAQDGSLCRLRRFMVVLFLENRRVCQSWRANLPLGPTGANPGYGHQRQACTITSRLVNIGGVIRSYGAGTNQVGAQTGCQGRQSSVGLTAMSEVS